MRRLWRHLRRRKGFAMRMLVIVAIAAGAISTLAPPAGAADARSRSLPPQQITTCPPDKPYCIQEIKPTLPATEVVAWELENMEQAAAFARADEARKTRVRAASGYRDPIARDTCPPPYRMTERDGCQLRR
jgi:hypothetical protein